MGFRFTYILAPVLALIASSAIAGVIAPQLQAEMDRSAPGTTFSVIVNMHDQADVASLDRDLQSRHALLKERHASVIGALQSAASTSQDALNADLQDMMRSGGILGYTGYWISNLLVVAGTKEAIGEIARCADVDVVEPNFKPQLIAPTGGDRRRDGKSRGGAGSSRGLDVSSRGIGVTPGLRAVRAPEVWHRLGYTGAGRLIGGLDTGVDANHPALAARWRGAGGLVPWQQCWLDVLGTGTQFPNDGNSHGTHTMETLTGLGAATNGTIGVAWGAKWIAANASNQGVGGDFDNDILACFQWFADPDGDPGTTADVPDVIQNSWGVWEGLAYPSNCDARWWDVVDNCEAAGVVVIFSAGNEGPNAQTLRSPSDRATTVYNAFAVGAVDATNYQWPYPIANFSSRGPSGCTGVPPANLIKPEIAAPSVSVYSAGSASVSEHHVNLLGNELRQNEPNPFNPITTIKFTLSNPSSTRLQIFDASGRLVRTLLDQQMTSGVHGVPWNGLDDAGRPVGAGTYFYRLKAGAFEQSRRMTILK
jgi:hypothetical protein